MIPAASVQRQRDLVAESIAAEPFAESAFAAVDILDGNDWHLPSRA